MTDISSGPMICECIVSPGMDDCPERQCDQLATHYVRENPNDKSMTNVAFCLECAILTCTDEDWEVVPISSIKVNCNCSKEQLMRNGCSKKGTHV